jgi:hypothetical protein
MKFTNQKQIRAAFWEAFPNLPRRRSRVWDKTTPLVFPTDTRCAFVDFIDALHRAGAISDSLAHRATL